MTRNGQWSPEGHSVIINGAALLWGLPGEASQAPGRLGKLELRTGPPTGMFGMFGTFGPPARPVPAPRKCLVAAGSTRVTIETDRLPFWGDAQVGESVWSGFTESSDGCQCRR